MDFFVALIFDIYIKFLDLLLFNLLDLNKFTTILSKLLSLTTLLLLALNVFKANFLNNFFVFYIEISNAAILLRP